MGVCVADPVKIDLEAVRSVASVLIECSVAEYGGDAAGLLANLDAVFAVVRAQLAYEVANAAEWAAFKALPRGVNLDDVPPDLLEASDAATKARVCAFNAARAALAPFRPEAPK